VRLWPRQVFLVVTVSGRRWNFCMSLAETTTQIEVVYHERPDAKETKIRGRLRGRDKTINFVGGDFRKRIAALEDQLAASTHDAELQRIALDRSRRNVARLSEHTGLCAELRDQVQQRNTWLGEWRRGCESLKAEAATTHAALERQLADQRNTIHDISAAAAFADEQHLELTGRLTALGVSHTGLLQEVFSAQAQRDDMRTQLLAAERVLRHALRARAKSADQLIATGAQLATSQAELLASHALVIDLQRQLFGAQPGVAPAGDDQHTLPAPLGEAAAADDLASLTEEAAADVSDPPTDVATILLRDPQADVSAYVLLGEPASPDGSVSADTFALAGLASSLDEWPAFISDGGPAHSLPGSRAASPGFDPLSPRLDGTTSLVCSPVLLLSPASD
jgi:hypothetical protein